MVDPTLHAGIEFSEADVADAVGPLGAKLKFEDICRWQHSVVMTMLFTELFVHIRHLAPVRSAVRGVMAAFVGMLAWVTISLGLYLAESLPAYALAAAAFAVRYLKSDTLRVFGAGLLLWAAALQVGIA